MHKGQSPLSFSFASLFFLVIAFATLAIYQEASAQNTINFLTYTNPNLGFTIEYPDDWIVNENIEPDTVYIGSGDISTSFIINIEPVEDPNMTLEELGNMIVETNSNSQYGTNFRLLEMNTNNYFLGGYPAVRFVAVAELGQMEMKIVGLGTIVDGKTYGTLSFAESSTHSYYSPIFQHMIETFQITP